MTCHPYKPICRQQDHPVLRGRVLQRVVVALLAMCILSITSAAQAQWGSRQWSYGPSWGPPVRVYSPYRNYFAPAPYYAAPYDIVGQQYSQTGPVLPPIIVDDAQPTITSYPPAEQVLPPIDDVAASAFDHICGQLRVVVPEAFLNRLLARCDTDAGPVTDFILGANVTGHQNTDTCVTVDVQPSQQTARLFLQLTGTTVNQTIGVTQQAAVRSRGNHQFRLTKQVDFDGLTFTTRSPAAWVTPQLTHEGAQTMLSGVPLIGQIANQIALSEAERQRPAAEQIITRRVTDQAAPRFNSEVDQKLAEANVRLQALIPQTLGMAGLSAANATLASTDSRLLYGLNVPVPSPTLPGPALTIDPLPVGDAQQAGDDAGFIVIRQIGHRGETKKVSVTTRKRLPPPAVVEGNAFTVAVHEDFVNHLLQQLPLGGQEVPDRMIDRLLELLTVVLADLSLSGISLDGIGSEDPEFATILLAAENPLSVRFENSRLIITAHAGFRPLPTPEVPTQRVEIPFTLSSADGQLALVPGNVSVDSLSPDDDGPMMELARPIIRQQVAQRLQTLHLPTSLPLALPGLPQTTLTLRNVTLADGWLIIAVD